MSFNSDGMDNIRKIVEEISKDLAFNNNLHLRDDEKDVITNSLGKFIVASTSQYVADDKCKLSDKSIKEHLKAQISIGVENDASFCFYKHTIKPENYINKRHKAELLIMRWL